MKIAVLSDTHGLLRPGVLSRIAGCDRILHAGDIGSPEILSRLEEIAPVSAVRGNNDKEWAEDLPLQLTLEAEGLRLFMTHIKRDVPPGALGADIVICGHSHRWAETVVDGKLFLNPGSCGRRRFDQEISFALLTLENGSRQVEKIVLPFQDP